MWDNGRTGMHGMQLGSSTLGTTPRLPGFAPRVPWRDWKETGESGANP